MVDNVKKRITTSEFSQCPKCDYKDGFHIAFKPCEDEKTQLVLICPNCHSRFESGWMIDLNN